MLRPRSATPVRYEQALDGPYMLYITTASHKSASMQFAKGINACQSLWLNICWPLSHSLT